VPQTPVRDDVLAIPATAAADLTRTSHDPADVRLVAEVVSGESRCGQERKPQPLLPGTFGSGDQAGKQRAVMCRQLPHAHCGRSGQR
jgi:hypothetical protein